jgi:hypothetical protein
LADKLHAKVAGAIDNFQGERVSSITETGYIQVLIMQDGYTVTFRCVVENEVWTLTIHQPKGSIGKLTDICNQIVKDAMANQLDEDKYIALLGD